MKIHLKGYSSSQSHFLEINVKLTEKNKFVTHFVRKILDMCRNKQNVVVNKSLEEQLAGTRESRSVQEVFAHFVVLHKNDDLLVFFLVLIIKNKAIDLAFERYFKRSKCNYQRLALQKNYMPISKRLLQENITESIFSTVLAKIKSQLVILCSFKNSHFNYSC